MSSAGTVLPPNVRAFGKYELVAKLAVGGMAEIFLARLRDADPPRLAVIKRVLPHLAEDSRFVAMFRDEARLASRIEHENVCKVFELGLVGDTYFIAMEYLHGMPLSRVLLRSAKETDPIEVRMVTTIVVEACRGLHHAHELAAHDGRSLEVVHRDISPPNIFITDVGGVKLLDFGVAKARGATQRTRTGTVKGKNSYMSPEQIMGEQVDRRSDLFSLGIVMFESLTSSRLFSRESDFRTFKAITDADIPDVDMRRSGIPVSLKAVMMRALSRRREDRYATALEMGEAVEAAMAAHGGVAMHSEIAEHLAVFFHDDLEERRMLCAEALGLGDDGEEGPSEATKIDPPPRLSRPATPDRLVAPSAPEQMPPTRILSGTLDDDAPTVVRRERTPPAMRRAPMAPMVEHPRTPTDQVQVGGWDGDDSAALEFGRAQRQMRVRRLVLYAGLIVLLAAALAAVLARAPG